MTKFENTPISNDTARYLQELIEINIPTFTELYSHYTSNPGAWLEAAPNSTITSILGVAGVPYSVMQALYPMLPSGAALKGEGDRGMIVSMVSQLQDLKLILRESDPGAKQRKLLAITEFLQFLEGDIIKSEREMFSEAIPKPDVQQIVREINEDREQMLQTIFKTIEPSQV